MGKLSQTLASVSSSRLLGRRRISSLFHHIIRHLLQRRSKRPRFTCRNKTCLTLEASELRYETSRSRPSNESLPKRPQVAAVRATLPDADGFSFFGKKHLYAGSVAC